MCGELFLGSRLANWYELELSKKKKATTKISKNQPF